MRSDIEITTEATQIFAISLYLCVPVPLFRARRAAADRSPPECAEEQACTCFDLPPARFDPAGRVLDEAPEAEFVLGRRNGLKQAIWAAAGEVRYIHATDESPTLYNLYEEGGHFRST